MRIGIDVTASIYIGTGVATYYRSLIPPLIDLGQDHEFVLLGYAWRRFGQLELANRKVPLPPRLMEFLWNRIHRLPVEYFVGPVEVFHAWDYLQPPAKKAKLVTTIHDLTTLKFPMYHSESTVKAQEKRLGWVRREAEAIIVDSGATKLDVMKLLGIESGRIRVVPLAAGELYRQFQVKSSLSTGGKAEFRTREMSRVKRKYGIEGNYLLSVGTIEPRKNVKRTMEAFELIRETEFGIKYLVVAGNVGWGEDLNPVPGVVLLGRVPDGDLPGLYAGAEALVYPSLYEGFGLPVLEAMTVGCPVVTSDRGSLKEVAGRAAVLVDPEEVESIVHGIETAIERRESLIKKGLEQAQKFSWEQTARETLGVYESL